MQQSLLDTDDSGGLGSTPGKNKEPRWDEKIRWFSYPDDGQPYAYRLIGKPNYIFQHWVTTKKKDGNWGKPFAVLCKNFETVTGRSQDNGCKVCEFYREVNKHYGEAKVPWANWPDQIKKMGARPTMVINAIVRDIQTQGAPAGAKDWSFVAPLKIPKGLAETISERAKKFNKKPGGKPDEFYGFNHADHGKDLWISYNSQADAQKMYDLQVGMADRDRTPLTAEEREHAKYMTDFAPHVRYMADADVEQLLQRGTYYEMLQGLQAQQALAKVQSAVGLQTQQPPAQEIPRSVSTPTVSAQTQDLVTPAALATDDDGGITAGTDSDVPNTMTQAVKSTQATQPATPPVQSPTAAPAPTTGGGVAAEFARQHGKATKVVTQDYSALSLRTVKTGTEVAECFSQYSTYRTQHPDVCKQCPVKLDCMQVEE